MKINLSSRERANIDMRTATVVYFDQLSEAVHTQKLAKILFCCFQASCLQAC